jgi:hypothetical protein
VPLPEFWREEPTEERTLFLKQIVRLVLLFAGLSAGVFFAFWWSGSAIHFGASRLTESTRPTYMITGKVTDARTGAPIPWVSVQDDTSGQPPFQRTLGSLGGEFNLQTIAEPHFVLFSALGYKPERIKVGKAWYHWMPSGSEQLQVKLEQEARTE